MNRKQIIFNTILEIFNNNAVKSTIHQSRDEIDAFKAARETPSNLPELPKLNPLHTFGPLVAYEKENKDLLSQRRTEFAKNYQTELKTRGINLDNKGRSLKA